MRVVIHKEGFAIEAFTVLYWNRYEEKRKFFLVLKKWKWKRKLKVKVRKKMRDEEGGKNQKTAKATMYKWVGKEMMKDLGDVVKEIVLAI